MSDVDAQERPYSQQSGEHSSRADLCSGGWRELSYSGLVFFCDLQMSCPPPHSWSIGVETPSCNSQPFCVKEKDRNGEKCPHQHPQWERGAQWSPFYLNRISLFCTQYSSTSFSILSSTIAVTIQLPTSGRFLLFLSDPYTQTNPTCIVNGRETNEYVLHSHMSGKFCSLYNKHSCRAFSETSFNLENEFNIS